ACAGWSSSPHPHGTRWPSGHAEADARQCDRARGRGPLVGDRGKLWYRAGPLEMGSGPGNADARAFHRCDLALGVALATRHDSASMAHRAAFRSCASSDEASRRLLAAARCLIEQELCCVFLGRTADTDGGGLAEAF